MKAACAAALVGAALAFTAVPAACASDGVARAGVLTGRLATLLAESREHLALGDAQAAYAKLDAGVGLYAGDPEFDYLLGLAALDTGHVGVAILALERVLLVMPGHLQARAELGRAYLASGERDNARTTLREVAAADIPPDARRVIGRYLDEIARLDAAARITVAGSVAIELGHDSNANVGSTSSQWLLGDGTPVIPLPASLPRRSALAGLDAALSMAGPMSGPWHWTAGVRSLTRRFPSAGTMNQQQVDLSAGIVRQAECHRITVLGQYQDLWLDNEKLRRASGLVAQWQCNPNPRSSFGTWLQVSSLSFPGQHVRDATRRTLGVSMAHSLGPGASTVLAAALYGGDERASSAWPNLTHRHAGVRVSLSTPLAAGWRGHAGAYLEWRRFDGPEPLFARTRHDRQAELQLGAERYFGKAWSIQPQVSLMRNASTLDPNDFRRTQFLVRANYQF